MIPEPGAVALAERDIVTPGSVVAEPWANGLGITRVLHRRLAWRLSAAEIKGSQRFSTFAGADRILLVTGDQPLGLTIDGLAHRLAPGDAVRFAGEARVVPAPTSLGATVVNLIAQRSLAALEHEEFATSGNHIIEADDARITVVLTSGAAIDGIDLPPGAAILPSPGLRTLTGSARAATLTIIPVDSFVSP